MFLGERSMNFSRKSLLNMSAAEAQTFFLKPDSYVNMLLPEYFDFQPVLDSAKNQLESQTLASIIDRKSLESNEQANHTILLNKDAGYDWRPVKIIHPLLYVNLVKLITKEENWQNLLIRFTQFQADERIECISIPVESTGDKSDTAETILNWWEEMEQNSIVKSLKFAYSIKTDITNCYGSIYTHTIDWAIRGKEDAKDGKRGKDKSFGHSVDYAIEQLQCGQTNGIPQGGVLFNFIAEIVLGYSDMLLSEKLNKMELTDWSIIRYRDDYRVFSNSKDVAEQVIKVLADILSDLNMHFNSKKTGITSEIIESAIKPDKIYWNARIPIIMPDVSSGETKQIKYQLTIQKHLLEILWLSKKYPNSGSINKALISLAKRLDTTVKIKESILPMVSIIVDIISNNPKVIPAGVGVLSKLLIKGNVEAISISEIVSQISIKLENTPNLNYLDIWLQRLMVQTNSQGKFTEKLCNAVLDSSYSIWDSSFITAKFQLPSVVDVEKLKSIKPEIDTDSFDVFRMYD